MEVAGLVLGIVATWKSCVEVFDLVSSSRSYGLDYEICRVKLEVERVRLLAWGDAVGLSQLENNQPHPDDRLNREQTRTVVLQVLGCLQGLFEDNNKLQDRYGLVQEVTRPGLGVAEPTSGLPLVFRKAYGTLKNISRERQRTTRLPQKTLWVIHDKTKFLHLVTEVRQWVDSLANLFPDLPLRDALKSEINQSIEIRPLSILREASNDDHADLSDTASLRLDALGATETARSVLSEDVDQGTMSDGAVTPKADDESNAESEDEKLDAAEDAVDPELAKLNKRLEAVDAFVMKQREGGLITSLNGPYNYSTKVSSYVGWTGDERNDDFGRWSWQDRDRGFVKPRHDSFDSLYYRKRFQPRRREQDEYNCSEKNILIDPECHPQYEHVNTGTLTVEGFALEAWDHVEQSGNIGDKPIFVSASPIPSIDAKRLLRRVDDLQNRPGKLGWDPQRDKFDLEEFIPDLAEMDRFGEEYDFYRWLNRRDLGVNIADGQPMCALWSEEGKVWNLLWVLIIAKELGRRMEETWPPKSWVAGFTERVLISVMIADLWFKNVIIVPKILPLIDSGVKPPESAEDLAKAEELKQNGNEALNAKKYQDAVDYYTKAMVINSANAVYHCNRAAALTCLEKHEDALIDARTAIELKPDYAKAWARLGAVLVKLGNLDDGLEAYSSAIKLAGNEATATMLQGREGTLKLIKELNEKIDGEQDAKKQHGLINSERDRRWELRNHDIQFHSRVHERQTAGLIFFAEEMRWPYINETRDSAEDAYHDLRSGVKVHPILIDWCFGLTLPGRRAGHNLMSTLILCTPSIAKTIGVSGYFGAGVCTPKYSYWPIRSVLGRILGALPGIQSLCGWIGPCPAVELISKPNEYQPRHVRLKVRKVAPIKEPTGDDNTIYIGDRYDDEGDLHPGADEDLPSYIDDMMNKASYLVPGEPVKQLGVVTLETVRLKRLASEVFSRSTYNQPTNIGDHEDEFRASLVFSIDNNEAPISYILYTNPVFVTAPPCYQGPHKIHHREKKRFEMRHWEVARLKDHVPEDSEGEKCMVINATDKGADVLARAWCSERGKIAVIRKENGPCFVCAVRCAYSLSISVLIWTR